MQVYETNAIILYCCIIWTVEFIFLISLLSLDGIRAELPKYMISRKPLWEFCVFKVPSELDGRTLEKNPD